MTGQRRVGITCLGCGLLCDDVTVAVTDGSVGGMLPPCPLGSTWLGSGAVPDRIRASGKDTTFESAISAAASLLAGARGRLLVYLGPGLTIEALKPAVAIADRLQATTDTATSAAAASGILAGQRRGRAAATIGELKNRADLVLFWGADPVRTHPRLLERLVDAKGTHTPGGRTSRTLVSVRVGADGTAEGADLSLQLPASAELAALSTLRSMIAGGATPGAATTIAGLSDLAARLVEAKYVAIVADGEDGDPARPSQRAEGLVALAQALNTPTRAALFTLRSGDNRNGVESLLTWQTGYPFAVEFRNGFPVYAADRRGLEDVGSLDAVLLVGDWRAIPAASLAAIAVLPGVVVGPGASEVPGTSMVSIDTGRAGVHEGGTAYRMDDVPLPVTPVLDGPRTAAMVLGALEEAVSQRLREEAA
jgi:formylmethanofuran dehydrogenase subunit B